MDEIANLRMACYKQKAVFAIFLLWGKPIVDHKISSIQLKIIVFALFTFFIRDLFQFIPAKLFIFQNSGYNITNLFLQKKNV